jgi:ABC-type branched-subunit amino acid transport system substrate-binding protein
MFDIGDLTPDKLQAAATNLIERQNVDVLINGYGGMGPDIPAFCPYPLPYIHNDATSNVVELVRNMGCKSIFMGSDYDVNYGRITFQQLMDLDYEYPNKKWAIIQGPYDWELNTPTGAEEVAKKHGWEVVVREQVPYEIKQWGGILSKLREANPALIYLEILDPAAVKTFIDQFLENPPKQSLLYIGYTISVPAFSEVVKRGAADGVLGMTLSAHMPNAKGREFVAKWKQKYNEDPPFSIAAQIYDEVMLWATAVTKVGSVRDFAAINDTLRNMTYEGITGTLKFNEEQFIPSADDTMPTHLLQVQGSEVKQVRIGTKKQSDFRKPPWIE